MESAPSPPPLPRRRRRWPYAVGAALALAVALALGVRLFLPPLIGFAARRATGWTIRLGDARVRWRPLRLSVRDFAVANPAGFPEGPALDLREVYLEYGGPSPGASSRETRLRELRVDVARLAMLRRADGRTNWDQLLGAMPEPRRVARPAEVPPPIEPPAAPSETAPAPPILEETETEPTPMSAPAPPVPAPPAPPKSSRPAPPPRSYRIERLVVKIGTLEQRDEVAAPGAPAKVIELNRTLVFTNVTDMAQVSSQLSFALSVILAPRLFDDLFFPAPE